jgi:cellulose synthase/poly-beta-1,6-N-acetylglucosamine synthase-like glycosyltransferase
MYDRIAEYFVVVISVSGPSLSIVVPAYNEADSLPALYRRLAPILDGLGESWELVLINDGSTDATLDVMQRLRAQDQRIAIVNPAMAAGVTTTLWDVKDIVSLVEVAEAGGSN